MYGGRRVDDRRERGNRMKDRWLPVGIVAGVLFARPLTGVDYVIAKVGALFSILFLFSFLPQVVLFVGQEPP